MIELLVDGYQAGLAAAWWILAASLGAATILAPLALGSWLIAHNTRRLTHTNLAWRIRTWPATRRAHRHARGYDDPRLDDRYGPQDAI